ncbi:hypothetical protein [Vibrio gallicus]|uniref:hypothetical protein n=1 Tax=Vibrio gallicus TaxID=190897 RepID=UPI0021C4354F|nr:hypothetical protein [Vibrio gallicus]
MSHECNPCDAQYREEFFHTVIRYFPWYKPKRDADSVSKQKAHLDLVDDLYGNTHLEPM